MIFDCIIKGMNRRVQLIGVEKKINFAMSIISNFDLTHCQVAYDGNDVVCTGDFIHAMKNRVTAISKVTAIHAYRLVKAYDRGYSIAIPNQKVYIKNCYHRYFEDQLKVKGIPTNTDKPRRIEDLADEMGELLVNKIVQQNLHENFMIDFTSKYEDQLDTIDKLSDMTPDLRVYNQYGDQVINREKIGCLIPCVVRTPDNCHLESQLKDTRLGNLVSSMGLCCLATRYRQNKIYFTLWIISLLNLTKE
jgi:hypothetical protein